MQCLQQRATVLDKVQKFLLKGWKDFWPKKTFTEPYPQLVPLDNLKAIRTKLRENFVKRPTIFLSNYETIYFNSRTITIKNFLEALKMEL